jgi:hypothetical protein
MSARSFPTDSCCKICDSAGNSTCLAAETKILSRQSASFFDQASFYCLSIFRLFSSLISPLKILLISNELRMQQSKGLLSIPYRAPIETPVFGETEFPGGIVLVFLVCFVA